MVGVVTMDWLINYLWVAMRDNSGPNSRSPDRGFRCVSGLNFLTSDPSAGVGFTRDEEPGMLGLEVKTGDAILFTEALRHSGFTNHKDETRMTLHVGYGPYWMMSPNIATMDEPLFIKPETWKRYNAEQKELFQPWLRQGPEYQLT